MTDQELKEMLADLLAAQKETDRIFKQSAERAEQERRKIEAELAEERRKTEQERRKIEAELAEERRKTEEGRRKIEAELAEERGKTEAELAEERRKTEAELAEERRKIEAELAEERRKTEAERRETERVIRQVNKQLGELGNKFGSFTEGMAFPSMEKILRNRFKMDVVTLRAKSRQNGHSIEIDVMAYDNGSRNEVYLVEVKNHLTREGIEQMLQTIECFPKFFGAHRDRTIYGVIAAVDIPDNLRAEVLNQGLYLARIHDETFELLTPRGFKPAPFGPAARQNGKGKKRPSAKK